jgi:excisionase family DNA binding protein
MKKKDTTVPEPAEGEPKNRPSSGSSVRDPLMTVKEAAIYLRLSKSFLDKSRLAGNGPPFSKAGRKVLYRKSLLDAWLMQRQFASTSQYVAGGS